MCRWPFPARGGQGGGNNAGCLLTRRLHTQPSGRLLRTQPRALQRRPPPAQPVFDVSFKAKWEAAGGGGPVSGEAAVYELMQVRNLVIVCVYALARPNA